MEKIKIISGSNYSELEVSVNEFIKDKIVRDIKVIEIYDIGQDTGFCSYHIWYSEQAPFVDI
jgi:hypothetical protein